jgi:AhpD family alkylhydroperoxidase
MTIQSQGQRPSLFPSIPETSPDAEVQAAFAKSHALFGHVSDLFNKLANAPTLLGGWIDMLRPIRNTLTVSPQLSELATIRVTQLNHCQLMTNSHSRLARRAGVSEDKVAAVADWQQADCYSPVERDVLGLTEQLTVSSQVPDELISALQQSIGVRATLELVIVVSYYCCTTRVANVVRSDPFQFSDEG